MESEKMYIDDLIYKAEIDAQTERTSVRIPWVMGGWDEMGDWD